MSNTMNVSYMSRVYNNYKGKQRMILAENPIRKLVSSCILRMTSGCSKMDRWENGERNYCG